jgi:uncharacterized Zn-binding protein involved in type VI secretion
MTVFINGLPVQMQGSLLTDGDIHALGNLTVLATERPVATVGQLTTGHGSFPPTVSVQGSPNVFISGFAVVRAGDAYAPHTDGDETHTGFATGI